jgi:hypothetical protein
MCKLARVLFYAPGAILILAFAAHSEWRYRRWVKVLEEMKRDEDGDLIGIEQVPIHVLWRRTNEALSEYTDNLTAEIQS